MIVPVDHKRPVRIRKEKKTNNDLSLQTTQRKEKLVSSENSTMPEDVFDDSSNQSLHVFDNNTSISEESTTRDVHRCSSACSN